ncbi:MAG: hypothetical protein IJM14_10980 [Lachnospiraceae bacterium]|nr:hypothetical protein [Lachnospiraceae bacterium]
MRKTMSKSLQRQFEIVHFIADCKEGTHFSDLVKRFKVSRATIANDLDFIETFIGVRMIRERGRYGKIAVYKDYKYRLKLLSEEQQNGCVEILRDYKLKESHHDVILSILMEFGVPNIDHLEN